MIKNYFILVPLFAIVVMIYPINKGTGISNPSSRILTDTIPNICNIIPPADMKYLNPFTNILTNIFPDPNNYDNYSGCHYQFYTPDANEKGQIAIRLIKWGSKKEAGDDFRNFFNSEWNSGVAPERLYGIADSAYFDFDFEDTTKCDECGLVATTGAYGIYIAFKGQYEKVPRARKKESALKILQMMYHRVPGLAPSRIRNIK
ncbi:MAG TPA: hypothetical protein VFO37_12935 [Chitinophagaceae bacterium]|nr:hypothetical protein [Chitinophagaceae bacterium]